MSVSSILRVFRASDSVRKKVLSIHFMPKSSNRPDRQFAVGYSPPDPYCASLAGSRRRLEGVIDQKHHKAGRSGLNPVCNGGSLRNRSRLTILTTVMSSAKKLVADRRERIVSALTELLTSPQSPITSDEIYHFEFVASAYCATGVINMSRSLASTLTFSRKSWSRSWSTSLTVW